MAMLKKKIAGIHMKMLFRQLIMNPTRDINRVIYICVVFRDTGLEKKICTEKRKRFRFEH